MPNLKLFKRRSSGNALDFPSTDPPPGSQSSFKVLERPERASTTYHAAPQKNVNTARPFQSPLQQLRGKSADDLGLGVNRGSGGTTNSGSSGYYESSSASARHSSTSTLPSSVDQERERERERELENEELYPHPRKAATTPMQHFVNASADEPLPPPPSFKSRAARTFSFGQKHSRSGSVQKDVPPLPPVPTPSNNAHEAYSTPSSPLRDRSMTTSSYASTAKPPPGQHAQIGQDFNLNLGESSFGDDFSNMFAGVGKSAAQSREDLPLPPTAGRFHRTESEPMYPPRTLSRQALTPSPNAFRSTRDDGGSPYDWDGRNSQEGLISNSALSSPRLFDDAPPPPVHGNGIAPAFLGKSKSGYALVPERNPSPGLDRRSSESTTSYASDSEEKKEQEYNTRQKQLDDGERWVKRVELHDPQEPSSYMDSGKSFKTQSAGNTTLRAPPQAGAGASRSGAISPASEEGGSLFGQESSTTTPKANRLAVGFTDDTLFDSSPVGPPSRAIRPGHQRTESGTPRKMTKAQFEALQRSGNNSLEHSEDETHEEDDLEDEDEAERAKLVAKQRRKQEANMAVYRQQMKKVTGGGPADLPQARPSMDRAPASAPPATGMAMLHLGGTGGTPPADSVRGKPSDDEDEDVPLGVLQAHGFPGSGRPPTRQAENDQQRRMSVAGSVANGGAGQGNLPPFARRLPADPYFGASLVNGANRESLAFSSAQSVYGGAPPMQGAMPGQMQQQMGHPGGLVGVIASEERAKASRRGSPNPVTGTYGMPLPQNMPGQMPQMPQMPRTMSMGSIVAPQVYTPSGYMAGMPPMPAMPAMPAMPGMPQMMPQQDQNQQQMAKFFEMQMQLMQNMLNMQQQQMGTPQPQQQTPDYLSVPFASQRPTSMASQAQTFQNAAANQGRAMTMMNPPPSWEFPQGAQRPISAMPNHYAPSAMNGGGPGPGYTPSIAPSERSNVGMPSRYRPVSTMNDAPNGRSHSMTSSMTLQAFTNGPTQQQQQRPESRQTQQKSTIRIIDKPKGGPKVTSRPVADEEEDDGWAEMAKKRTEKKFNWRGKKDSKAQPEPALSDLYRDYE